MLTSGISSHDSLKNWFSIQMNWLFKWILTHVVRFSQKLSNESLRHEKLQNVPNDVVKTLTKNLQNKLNHKVEISFFGIFTFQTWPHHMKKHYCMNLHRVVALSIQTNKCKDKPKQRFFALSSMLCSVEDYYTTETFCSAKCIPRKSPQDIACSQDYQTGCIIIFL